MNVTRFDGEKYRGFELGWTLGLHGYLAAWRSSLDDGWCLGHVYVDVREECGQLAKECVDYFYAQDAREVELGRKLTMDEVLALGKELSAQRRPKP